MYQQFGFPHGLRHFIAPLIGAIFLVFYATPTWAADPLVVNEAAANCNDDGSTDVYCSIQAAIDAAAPGDTINVYPATYDETASGRTILEGSSKQQGPHQFGLFIKQDDLVIQGVDASGNPLAGVPETATVMPEVRTNATNNFGNSGIWIEGDNVTISGLRILDNAPGNNKSLEIVGNAFTLKYSHINVTDRGSVYLSDWLFDSNTSHVESYTIEGNLFSRATVDIASGVGVSGPVENRKIIGNQFLTPPAVGMRAYVSFSGAGGTGWFVDPVGGAIITGNTFGVANEYIRARGDYLDHQFDWASYWNDNAFAKAAMVGPNPPADVRTYEYTDGAYTFTNVRHIGGLIQAEIDHAQPGDVVLIKAGLYEENLTVNKHVKLVGAGSGDDPASSTIIRRVPAVSGSTVVLAASGASAADPLLLSHLRIEPNGYYGINVTSLIRNVRLNDVQVVGLPTAHIESEVCLKVSTTSTVEYLDVQDSAFNQCDHGWYFAKHDDWGPGGSNVRYVTVRNSVFNDNDFKGIYVEKLSDALFENVQVVNNGSDPNWNAAWNGGLDVNLKGQESYQNLIFRNLTVTGNGLGFQHGAGVMIKARDDGGTYGAHPATLTNVLIEGGVFTGNERGIRVGEPDKNNAGPTNVQIHGAALFGNEKTYSGEDGSAYGDLINYTQSQIDATGNWWGVAEGPQVVAASAGIVGAAQSSAPGVIYAGSAGVDYNPFLTEPPATTLLIPNAIYNIPNAVSTIAVPVQLNPNGASLATVAFSVDYDQTCLSVTSPASVTGAPAGFTPNVSIDTSDTDGELDIAVYDANEPYQALPQGTLLTIEFTIDPTCRGADRVESIQFSNTPSPSFGTTSATSVAGTWLGGNLTLDFNQAATAINLTGNRVYEGMPSGDVVGTLSVTDADTWETFTYAFAGGADDSLFTLSNNQVKAKGPYNYNTKSTLTIRVKATGSGGTTIEQDLTINVADYSTLSLPAAGAYRYGIRGSSVGVPVSIAPRSNAVVEAQFTVNYDAACLSFSGISDLPSGWTGNGTAAGGSVAVSMNGATALSSGQIALLNFSATGACGTYPAPLTFGGKSIKDASGPVSARSSDGAIRIIANSPSGDCNTDGAVNAADFLAVVMEFFDGDGDFWLDAPLPTFSGSPIGCNANANGTTPSGTKIEMGDLSCTVNIVFGDSTCTGTPWSAGAALANQPAELVQGYAVADNGVIEIPVALQSNGNAVAAAAFVVNYDPALYTLDQTDENQDGIPDAVTFHVPANVTRWAFVKAGEGKLQLAAAGLQLPLQAFADGPIATVRLQTITGADGADIYLDNASLGNTGGFEVPVIVTGPDVVTNPDGSTDPTLRIFLPTIQQ